jgi:hypothetical protein
MAYIPMQTIQIPLRIYMELEFHLMDARPGLKPDAFVVSYLERWLKLEAEREAIRSSCRIRSFECMALRMDENSGAKSV